jgi:hypothetical protein
MANYDGNMVLYKTGSINDIQPYFYTLRARDSAAPAGSGYVTWKTKTPELGYDTAPTPYPYGGPLVELSILFISIV